MGARVLDRLVRPIVGGVHAADPDDLSVDAVAPGLSAARAPRVARAGGPLAARVGTGRLGRAGHRRRHAPPGRRAGRGPAGPRLRGPHGRRGDRGAAGRRRLDGGRRDRAAARARDPAAPALLGLSTGTPDPGAEVTLVTLVLRAPELDARPARHGRARRPGGDRRRREGPHARHREVGVAGPRGRSRTHVVRLSYGRAGCGDTSSPTSPRPCATRPRCSASPLDAEQVLGHATVRWTQALPRPSEAHRAVVAAVRSAVRTARGVAVCGAWVAGNGLASVVPDARSRPRARCSDDVSFVTYFRRIF